ncbi:hypothetical protein PR202_ga28780 [Eleusine coracana subsp. coracana]|uniref:Probable zinc-ribbon domain-containing protein n=1 Tax=Eleusine coracana subsp. coracana TaxID=191504 RepID=A0AAV5DJQ6_ELECO|nr:hypothetical protein PR202_ga28780 [Eleusine coracana subsp. coracana]
MSLCTSAADAVPLSERKPAPARHDVASSASPSRSGPPPPQTPSRQLGSGDVASTSRSSTPTPPYARSGEQQPAATTSRRYGSGDILVSARRHHGSGDVARSSSTPDVRTSDLVSARRNHGSSDVARSSSMPDVATSTRRQETNRRETSDLVLVRKERAGEVASSSSSAPDATASTTTSRRQQATDTGSPRESSGDLVSASSKRVSAEHVPATERKEHEQSCNGGARGSSEFRRKRRDTGDAADSPGKDQACSEPQAGSEKKGKGQSEPELPDAARRKHSGEATAAVQPQEEPAPRPSVQAEEPQPSRDAPTPVAATGNVPAPTSPPRHHHHELLPQAEDLAPLRRKILKTVDALKGDLSELFSKSPDLNPTTTRARPPHPRRVPDTQQQGHHASPRRAVDPPPTTTREPPAPSANNKEVRKRRPPPPRHHCRPVLKGAPFIICSSCFALVQVPADFAVSTNRLRRLRCGACAAVLSYSYRDPARKQLSSVVAGHHQLISAQQQPDPFAPFVEGFGLSSYSTTDAEDHESPQSQRLHVSRNTSFGTVDGGAERQGRLHRLMGYGSASELLRHSPDLYESFRDDRATPDYDRKGKGVCLDDVEDDDSDDEDVGVRKRVGLVWPMMMPDVHGPAGAIRIKS